jgi:hypothetical protein
MYSRGALVASASTRQGLPGSSADLSTRAVPNHPGRSNGCLRLLLHHRSCLASSKSGGLATFVFLSRPNRVHLRYGSRVRLASSPARLLGLALARLRAEQAIYTMNSFQFMRSARLILAYPTNGRRKRAGVHAVCLPFTLSNSLRLARCMANAASVSDCRWAKRSSSSRLTSGRRKLPQCGSSPNNSQGVAHRW